MKAMKRKDIGLSIENEDPVVKKFREGDYSELDLLANSDGDSSVQTANPDSVVPDKPIVALIDCLYEDVLVEIFQWLPYNDRIRIERVSKKWNQAAKKSWSNFRTLNYMKSVQSRRFLRRGGRFVDKLSMSILEKNYTVSTMCSTLFLAPNVKHVKLEMLNEAYVLINLLEFSSQLKSLSLTILRKPTCKTLNKLLSRCNQLEYLELVRVEGYKFEYLPCSLKVLSMDEVNSEQLAGVLIAQKIALEALFLPLNHRVPDPCHFLTRMDLSKLRCLSIRLSCASWMSFNAVAHQLSNLVSLDLDIRNGPIANEVLEMVLSKMQQLQSLSLHNFHEVYVPPSNIVKLSNLKNLRHVSLCSVGLQSSCLLLRALIGNAKLQYFYTDSCIPMDLMSEALCKCECLTYLCANDARFGDQGSDASLIRRALNEIFGEGTVPTVSGDARIRHLFLGYTYGRLDREVDSWAVVSHPWVFFSHPWAVFYQSGSNFPEKGFSEYRVFPVQSDG